VLVGDWNRDGQPDVAVLKAVFGSNQSYFTVLMNRTQPVSLSPNSLTYATELVGTSSKAQSVVVTNNAATALSLSDLAITGTDSADFKFTNGCPASLGAGLQCTVGVVFDPAVSGNPTAELTGAGSATVALSGVATQVELTPAKLNFATVPVGQSSSVQQVTLKNVGTTTVSFAGIKVVGTDAADFSETNTCGTSVAAGSSCTISITFKPSATGARTADVRLIDNGGASPQYAPLAGTGS
jgi:hypothetical protein